MQLCTLIPHPNVFEGYDYNAGRSEDGVWLCLNMLRSASLGSYSGWSGAYSVYSILVQLQSFLFAENIDQDYGYAATAAGHRAPHLGYWVHGAVGESYWEGALVWSWMERGMCVDGLASRRER